MSADGDARQRQDTIDLKEINRPLLDVDKKSESPAPSEDEVMVPPHTVAQAVDDTASGFTKVGLMRQFNKTQAQSNLEQFLNIFMDSAGKQSNMRDLQDKKSVDDSEQSDNTVDRKSGI